MTVYFVGTEDIHFIAIGVPSAPGTGAGNVIFRTAWARCALSLNVGPYIDMRYRAPLSHLPVSTDEFWWSCQLYQGGSSIIDTKRVVDFLSSGGFARIRVDGKSGEAPRLYRQNDDETEDLLATGTLPMPSGGRRGKIDIQISLPDDIFRIYSDYLLLLEFIGGGSDLTNGGEYSSFTGFDLCGSYGAANFSEIVWQEADTRKIAGVRSIWPRAAGFATDWVGSEADVDETQLDLTDSNYTSTVGLIQQYKVQSLPADLSDNVSVAAVMLGAEIQTGPTDVALNIRTGGSDYFSSDFDTGGTPDRKMKIWETNPDTSVAFTKDELNDANFNIGVKSS